jgi:hypothetical protein
VIKIEHRGLREIEDRVIENRVAEEWESESDRKQT